MHLYIQVRDAHSMTIKEQSLLMRTLRLLLLLSTVFHCLLPSLREPLILPHDNAMPKLVWYSLITSSSPL
jgi:hypothetical protein